MDQRTLRLTYKFRLSKPVQINATMTFPFLPFFYKRLFLRLHLNFQIDFKRALVSSYIYLMYTQF